MRPVTIAVLVLACCLVHGTALAQAKVLVLQPPVESLTGWPQAARVVVAELALRGFQVQLQSVTETLGPLSPAEDLARHGRAAGADAVVMIRRQADQGIAEIWQAGKVGVVRLEESVVRGSLAESSIALRVADQVDARQLQVPARQEGTEARPATQQEPAKLAPPTAHSTPAQPKWSVWAAPGLYWSPVTPAVAALGAAGASRLFADVDLAIDLDVAGTFVPLAADTELGRVETRAYAAGLRLRLEPWHEESFSVSFGLGVDGLWLTARGSGTAAIEGVADRGSVLLASGRLWVGYRASRWTLFASVDPGLTLTPIRLQSQERTLHSLGRPLFRGMAGLAWSL